MNFYEKAAGRKRLLKLDKLEEMILKTYKNGVIYKERTKKYHGKILLKIYFQRGHKVLLYNSQLRLFLGKLKSRWPGHFIVTKVFVNGDIEIQYPGDYHTFMVNDQRLKIYSGGEVPTAKVSLILAKP